MTKAGVSLEGISAYTGWDEPLLFYTQKQF